MGKRKKVLVVDDESPIAEMIAEFCQSFGFDTMILNSGEDVLKVVKSLRPDLITLDLIMSEVSGIEVLEALKADEETRNVPVIVISSLGNSGSAHEVLKLSQGFLSKPLKMEALEEKIETVLSAA